MFLFLILYSQREGKLRFRISVKQERSVGKPASVSLRRCHKLRGIDGHIVGKVDSAHTYGFVESLFGSPGCGVERQAVGRNRRLFGFAEKTAPHSQYFWLAHLNVDAYGMLA